jgi:uncharacterized cofD-like protein
LNIVALGGGTGLSTLLKGLKLFSDVNITAVVTVTDEGGSSGIIREELGILPPGDIRNNIVALAEDESLMAKVMSYRFREGQTFKNHSLGNLIIAALTKITGGFANAIEKLSDTLAIKGTVLPVTEDVVRLVARMEDGRIVTGETNIVKANGKIVDLRLNKKAKPYAKVIDAILKSDVVVLGPGSLYTSIIPNILVEEVKMEINKKPRILIANLMTQPGETNGFTLEDHVKIVEKYLQKPLDKIVVNTEEIPSGILKRYESEGSVPVFEKDGNDERMIGAPMIKLEKDPRDGKEKVRHDPVKLADLVRKVSIELMGE